MSDDEFVSPIDRHRHYGDAGRAECAVCCLQADRDRLHGLLAQTVDGGEWVLVAPVVIERLNTERNEAVIDAERERACRQIVDQALLDAVNERDRLRAERDQLREQLHEIAADFLEDHMRDVVAERDRLRAVADAAREFMAAFMAWRETVEDGKLPPLPVWGDDEERRRTASIAALADALSQLDVSPTGEDT